jgi:hypothetical protein
MDALAFRLRWSVCLGLEASFLTFIPFCGFSLPLQAAANPPL